MTETLRKRPLTADEIALRRSETARRRKNQSEQRLEEEKIETINRLLKPQAPRRRGGHRLRDESPGPSDTEGLVLREATPPPPATKVRIVRGVGGTVPRRPREKKGGLGGGWGGGGGGGGEGGGGFCGGGGGGGGGKKKREGC